MSAFRGKADMTLPFPCDAFLLLLNIVASLSWAAGQWVSDTFDDDDL
jgi:hypothetical protein